MRVSGISLAILICVVLLVSGVSAQTVDKTPGYSVDVVKSTGLPAVVVPMTVSSISQGQTNWYTYAISSGTSSLTVDLNWGNPANSLALTVIAPDGTIGPYYDTSGTGRITLLIKKNRYACIRDLEHQGLWRSCYQNAEV
jgi:hypothetical protein